MRLYVLLLIHLVFLMQGSGATARSLVELQSSISHMTAKMEQSPADIESLLSVRLEMEQIILELRSQLRERQERETQASATLQSLGPKLANGLEEPANIQTERRRLEQGAAVASAELRQTQVALGAADAVWNRANDLRRDIFFHRIFTRWTSPASPAFWSELGGNALPRLGDTLRMIGAEWRAHIDRPDGVLNIALLALLALLLIGAIVAIPRVIRRLIGRQRSGAGSGLARNVIVHRTLVDLAAGVLPVPLAIALFESANIGLDASPSIVDPILQKIAIALACVLLANRVLRILLSPNDAQNRIITASDRTALHLVRTGSALAAIYATGIIFSEFADLAHSMVVVTIMTTAITVFASSAVMIRGLIGLRDRDDTGVAQGIRAISLGWARPLLWIFAIATIILALAGYTSLAGFLFGRFIVTSLVIAFAILLIIVIDIVFAELLTEDRHMAVAAARTMGISVETIEVVATIISGASRLAVLAFAAFITFGRWHLEYGEANPFEDAFFGLSLGDIRLALGTVGFALLAFVIGIIATKMLVGWLDNQLLPRTKIDPGVRNSTTTILGYGGLALTIGFTLSLLGVNPQNLTVVAGALSVGIGFGLQAIVSNFVSGLILLAERPVRVGDTVLVKGDEGTIKKISVRSTVISGFDRSDIIVPNSDLISSVVRNRTFSDRTRQIKFSLTLDHAADPVEAAKICLSCIYHHANVLKTPMPKVTIARVSESGIELETKGVIDDLSNLENATSALMFQILGIFREKGIKLARAGG